VQLYKSAGASKGAVIARNGKTIMGVAEDLNIDEEITALYLVYNGSDWRIVR
jgi:phage-related protein